MAEIQNLKISNVESVEIILDGSRKQFFFSQIQDLMKGKKLVDIDISASQSEDMIVYSPSGNQLAGVDVLKDSYLTLNVKGREVVKNMPGIVLARQAQLKIVRPGFNELQPDWAKSFILLANSAGTAGQSILLTLYFND